MASLGTEKCTVTDSVITREAENGPAAVSPRQHWDEPHCVCVCCGEVFVVLFTFSAPVISFAVTAPGISLQVVAAVCSVP